MSESRQTLADFGDTGMVEVSDDHTRPFHFAIKDVTPRIDDHTVAVRQTAIFVLATLSDCKQVALVLDGSRTQQDFPVSTTRRIGESSGHQNQVNRCQRTE